MKLTDLHFPLIQLAVDLVDMEQIDRLFDGLHSLPDRVIVEAGTPLIKKYGMDAVRRLKELSHGAFTVADLKTLDVGSLEADIAVEGGADAAVVAGLAPIETLESFIEECHKKNTAAFVDSLGSSGLGTLLPRLRNRPDVIIFHRGIDEESDGKERVIESIIGPRKAIAGGLTAAEVAGVPGFDIYVIGRYVTASSNPAGAMASLIAAVETR